jgi:Lhr-like helicase
MSLHLFHKAVSAWFEKSFQTPTLVQTQAWEAIKSGKSTLIAAPTGSGKTLAAFLSAIDDLLKQSIAGKLQAKSPCSTKHFTGIAKIFGKRSVLILEFLLKRCQ